MVPLIVPDIDLDRLKHVGHDRAKPTMRKLGRQRLLGQMDPPFSPPEQVWIPADRLFVEPIFQRSFNQKWARDIAVGFDPDKFHPLLVSERANGFYAILDGQHRFGALEFLGWLDQNVPCLVYQGLTITEEAEIFASQGDRRSLSANELHVASVVAGRDDAMVVQQAIEAAGYRTLRTRSKQPDVVDCIGTAYRVVAESNPATLTRILSLLAVAWLPREWQPNPTALSGMRSFIARFDEQIVQARLLDVLSVLAPKDWAHLAQGQRQIMQGSIATNGARVLTQRYNRNLRSGKLPDWDRSIDG